MPGPERLLIVEDDELVQRSLARFFSKFFDPQVVATAREAFESLRGHRSWVGAVIDWKLPDQDGIELLAQVREDWPILPVLVVTAHVDPACINRVQELRAEFIVKPIRAENLSAFAQRVVGRPPLHTLKRSLDEIARNRRFSPTEHEVVTLIIDGVARSELAARLGVTENTVKTFVKRLLLKAEATSLDQLLQEIRVRASIAPVSNLPDA